MFPAPRVSPNGPGRGWCRSTLDRMTPPLDGRPTTSPHAAVRALALQVNRDTVLQARAALLAEADRLDEELTVRRGRHASVGLCGGDPVSPDAAAAFNERIDALVAHCRAYNSELRSAASTLDATARLYGYTDEEIAASYRSHP